MIENKNLFTGNVTFCNKWHCENWIFKMDNENLVFAPMFKRWIFQSGDRFNDYGGYSNLLELIIENHEFIEEYIKSNYRISEDVEVVDNFKMKINMDKTNNFYQKILFKHEDVEEMWFYRISYSNMWSVEILEPFSNLNNIMNSSKMGILINDIYFEVCNNILDSYGITFSQDFSDGFKRINKYFRKQFSFKYSNDVVMILNPK